jgi:hypothetical protein
MSECERPYLRLVKTSPEKETPPRKNNRIKRLRDYLNWRGLDLKTVMLASVSLCIIMSVCILGIMVAAVSLLN